MDPLNRWNRVRYGLYAPVYDLIARPLDGARERALDRLDPAADDRILLLGCGTGRDLASLPSGASVTAVDITPAMVRRTAARGESLGTDLDARVGDAQALPFEDDAFDAVVLHLVLSVVPDPDAVVEEAARVLAPDGRVSVLDKFVPTGTTPSLPRRAINPLARLAFSDLNRALEPMLAGTDLTVRSREPALHGLFTVATLEPGGEDA